MRLGRGIARQAVCRAAARRPGGSQCGPYLLVVTNYAGLRCLRPALPHAPAAGGESQRVGVEARRRICVSVRAGAPRITVLQGVARRPSGSRGACECKPRPGQRPGVACKSDQMCMAVDCVV